MQRPFRRIQHLLNALPVLEAAARLGSFTRAGEQLGLSQPTVSRHISNLETDLGVALFARDHNKLTVTKPGRELANAVDLGFSHIDAAVRKAAIGHDPGGLRLACTQSFANCWLLPRFSKLRQAAGGQQVHLLVSHWLDDIDLDQTDMFLHWKPDGWAGWPRIHLFDEITFPVCSPEYLERNCELPDCADDPSSLTRFELLHYDERATEFVSWSDWFGHFGLTYVKRRGEYRFSNYHFMLQAAKDGDGVALAWRHLVADQIAAGELVQVAPAFRRRDAGYVLEYRDSGSKAEQVSRIVDWFRTTASETRDTTQSA